MQYMFSLKSSLEQALWRFTIFANSYLALEKYINRFYQGIANLDKLKKK